MHYVLLIGVFNAKKKGHMSLASGSIAATRATVWPGRGPRDDSRK